MREETKEQSIRVVLVEPGKYAREAVIGTELSDLQEVCGGWIQTYYPFEEMVCIVCNDEGKLIGIGLRIEDNGVITPWSQRQERLSFSIGMGIMIQIMLA